MARFYDASLGRFHTLDPLAEKNYHQSLYLYVANSPIVFFDYMNLDDHYYLEKTVKQNGKSYTKKIHFYSVSTDRNDTYSILVSPVNNTLTYEFRENKSRFDKWNPAQSLLHLYSPFPKEMKSGVVWKITKHFAEQVDINFDALDAVNNKATYDLIQEIEYVLTRLH